ANRRRIGNCRAWWNKRPRALVFENGKRRRVQHLLCTSLASMPRAHGILGRNATHHPFPLSLRQFQLFKFRLLIFVQEQPLQPTDSDILYGGSRHRTANRPHWQRRERLLLADAKLLRPAAEVARLFWISIQPILETNDPEPH